MQKQVDRSHYEFSRYVNKPRWMSLWHQLDEVTRLDPSRVLEVGPGPGLFKSTATALGLCVETLDIDPELKPDHLASVFEMPFADRAFDVVCAFQMLEHLPFEKSLAALKEMARVAGKAVVVSMPDAKVMYPQSFHIPRFGTFTLLIPKPQWGLKKHQFDGEHCWEINKKGYRLDTVRGSLEEAVGVEIHKTYRVPESPYRRVFVFLVRDVDEQKPLPGE